MPRGGRGGRGSGRGRGGGGRGRGRGHSDKLKKPKDPHKPKTNPSSYFLFNNEVRASFREKYPAKKPSERAKLVALAVAARTTEFWGVSSSRRLPTAVPSLARLQQVGIRGGDMMPPHALFANAVDVGEEKAKAGVPRVLMLSIMSGTGKKVPLPA